MSRSSEWRHITRGSGHRRTHLAWKRDGRSSAVPQSFLVLVVARLPSAHRLQGIDLAVTVEGVVVQAAGAVRKVDPVRAEEAWIEGVGRAGKRVGGFVEQPRHRLRILVPEPARNSR